MAGRTPEKALENFLKPLRIALGCLSSDPLVHTGAKRDVDHNLSLNYGRPVLLDGAEPVAVTVQQRYRLIPGIGLVGRWKVTTLEYTYAIEDVDGSEILAYHWHGGASAPHLHLGPASGAAHQALRKAHVPTGRIAVEDFVTVLVQGFGVEPFRVNWSELLRASRERFLTYRTWH